MTVKAHVNSPSRPSGSHEWRFQAIANVVLLPVVVVVVEIVFVRSHLEAGDLDQGAVVSGAQGIVDRAMLNADECFFT